jgi:flagellar basal body-associated protein FliL
MLGFGKKKKKKDKEESSKETPAKAKPDQTKKAGDTDTAGDKGKSKADSKKKKRGFLKKIPIKLIFIIMLVLIAVGASGYVVYSMYFTSEDPFAPDAKYKAVELEHINLPEEMMEFTFKNFRVLYLSMIDVNKEINLLNSEIDRIDAIAKKYPDQKKIADKEKKIWEKIKKTLEKTIIKIETPIKKLYVLVSVNREQGMAQIEAKKDELSDLALNALKSANEKTLKLKPKDKVPDGFIKGNIYKLKKKFL